MTRQNWGAQASKMEKAKRLKGVKDLAPSSPEYAAMKRVLVTPDEDQEIEMAISGLTQEDEFAVMCHLMQTATHLIQLGQAPIIKGDFIVPDFMASFQPGVTLAGRSRDESSGFRCMVDVKSTTEKKYHIGGSMLKRRRNCAREFGLPLVLAVRFLEFPQHAGWVMVDASDEAQTSLTITWERDLSLDIVNILWDNYIYTLCPTLYIQRVYDTNAPAVGVSHVEYGNQQEIKVCTPDKIRSYPASHAIMLGSFLRCFNLHEVEVEKRGTTTIQTVKPILGFAFLSDVVNRFQHLVVDEEGNIDYNPSKILAVIDQDVDSELVHRSIVEKVADKLLSEEFLFLKWVGGEQQHLDQWRRLGGRD